MRVLCGWFVRNVTELWLRDYTEWMDMLGVRLF